MMYNFADLIMLCPCCTMLLYLALQGFAGDIQVRGWVLEGQRPSIDQLVSVSGEVKELIVKCWAQNSDDRPSFNGLYILSTCSYTAEVSIIVKHCKANLCRY